MCARQCTNKSPDHLAVSSLEQHHRLRIARTDGQASGRSYVRCGFAPWGIDGTCAHCGSSPRRTATRVPVVASPHSICTRAGDVLRRPSPRRSRRER